MSVIAANQTARTPSCIYKNKLQKRNKGEKRKDTLLMDNFLLARWVLQIWLAEQKPSVDFL
jgi:hypothetical protein